MNQSFDKVVRYLAGSEKLESVAEQELEVLGDEHPYFPIGQLLLAKKLKDHHRDADYLRQVQKTALYFSNPYWLQYLLSADDGSSQLVAGVDGQVAAGMAPGKDTGHNISTSDNGHVDATPPVTVDEEPGHIAASYTHLPEGLIVETPELAEELPVEVPQEVAGAKHPEAEQADEEMAATARDTNEDAANFADELDSPVTPPADLANVHFPLAVDAEVVALEEEMVGARYADDDITSQFLKEAANVSPAAANGPGEEDDEHDRMFQNIKAMLDASSEEADADTKNGVVHIDPYYTIDYFASQGIKLELDQNPQDQLGQNMKKFTQWLRHMKKLGPEDATEVISRTESEADIQHIADSSNTVREVVTEAMAMVLEKQGKNGKAIELYNKLSFLNPDKSAYFADKIKKLKGT